jgi:hypothetical protein
MIELERCDGDGDEGRIDRYNPKYLEELLHFFYKFTITRRVRELPPYERLCFLGRVHRTATQFRASNVVKTLTAIMGDCLPQFNGKNQQVSGPTLTDFARFCRWVLDQPDFPGLIWQLKLFLLDYLKEHVIIMTQSKPMREMFHENIVEKLYTEDTENKNTEDTEGMIRDLDSN